MNENLKNNVEAARGTTRSNAISFSFPFKPYNIQEQLMSTLYNTLEQSKVAIFESPTGTGKSLSLICGSLTWLRDFHSHQKLELQNQILLLDKEKENVEENDWFIAQSKCKASQAIYADASMKLDKILKQESRMKNLKRKCSDEMQDPLSLMQQAKKFSKESISKESEESDDDLLPDFENNDQDESDEEQQEVHHVTKIYFCSRTHSQLAQFVREIKKSSFGADARVVTLGSRQSLCVNETVTKLGSLSLINDCCTEMQKNVKKCPKEKNTDTEKKAEVGKKKKTASCIYFRHHAFDELKNHILASVQDIEEIVEVGKSTKTCPYYGSRLAIPDAEIVALPYNILLHKSTRDAWGVKLKDNIVIVDEAHNILETIGSINSVQVTGRHLSQAHTQLSQYLERYRNRLTPLNLKHIKQIVYVLMAFIKFLGGSFKTVLFSKTSETSESRSICLNTFLTETEIDHINMYDLLDYCKRSHIFRKLYGFSMKYQVTLHSKSTVQKSATSVFIANNFKEKTTQVLENDDQKQIISSPFNTVIEFFRALTNSNEDGKILITKDKSFHNSNLKFLLLNPNMHFLDVVREARSVILAGGTMHPVKDFVDQLFKSSGIPDEKIELFSCGHIIPKENILPIVLDKGPGNLLLDFTYKNRNSESLIDEVGRLIVNVCSVVPGGMVVFFPSYDYEERVYSIWEKSGVILRIGTKKRVFREPKKTSELDQVLSNYANAIKNSKKSNHQTGAILLSIVGGKMSEGINFSDNLGRCVILIGMPYPNMESIELKEKIAYRIKGSSLNQSLANGNEICNNLCMRAVNQSIGRAIRHSQDFAAVLLLDARYKKKWVIDALPKWISNQLQTDDKFGTTFSTLRKFFKEKCELN